MSPCCHPHACAGAAPDWRPHHTRRPLDAEVLPQHGGEAEAQGADQAAGGSTQAPQALACTTTNTPGKWQALPLVTSCAVRRVLHGMCCCHLSNVCGQRRQSMYRCMQHVLQRTSYPTTVYAHQRKPHLSSFTIQTSWFCGLHLCPFDTQNTGAMRRQNKATTKAVPSAGAGMGQAPGRHANWALSASAAPMEAPEAALTAREAAVAAAQVILAAAAPAATARVAAAAAAAGGAGSGSSRQHRGPNGTRSSRQMPARKQQLPVTKHPGRHKEGRGMVSVH